MCKYHLSTIIIFAAICSCTTRSSDFASSAGGGWAQIYNNQFVGHARYFSNEHPENSIAIYKTLVDLDYKIIECDVLFTQDSIPVLSHDENLYNLAHDSTGTRVNKKIQDITFAELQKYDFSISKSEPIRITTFEQVIRFAKTRNICVQVDLQKHIFGAPQCRILYDIVSKANMLDKVIWEVSDDDFFEFISLDNRLIYQLDETWSCEKIKELTKYKKNASLIILSKWFPNYDNIGEYKHIVDWGHQNGFLMKCAVINDSIIAKELWEMGVDLMTTDCLKNDLLSRVF